MFSCAAQTASRFELWFTGMLSLQKADIRLRRFGISTEGVLSCFR